MNRPEILAIVPARGGSKGIPRKNVIPVGGRPLIAYSIEQALTSRLVTRTVVSTDDTEIAAVARAYGGDVPFLRPAQYAQDMSARTGCSLATDRASTARRGDRSGDRADARTP
jgi:CMP-N,N'-diacetyllegionaminic acid synthase